jgi:hypothetical protein
MVVTRSRAKELALEKTKKAKAGKNTHVPAKKTALIKRSAPRSKRHNKKPSEENSSSDTDDGEEEDEETDEAKNISFLALLLAFENQNKRCNFFFARNVAGQD